MLFRSGELVLQHLGILAADVVELVILLRDVDLLLELADARPLVDERELDKNRAVKVDVYKRQVP